MEKRKTHPKLGPKWTQYDLVFFFFNQPTFFRRFVAFWVVKKPHQSAEISQLLLSTSSICINLFLFFSDLHQVILPGVHFPTIY
jgi:hypothetical protein